MYVRAASLLFCLETITFSFNKVIKNKIFIDYKYILDVTLLKLISLEILFTLSVSRPTIEKNLLSNATLCVMYANEIDYTALSKSEKFVQ